MSEEERHILPPRCRSFFHSALFFSVGYFSLENNVEVYFDPSRNYKTKEMLEGDVRSRYFARLPEYYIFCWSVHISLRYTRPFPILPRRALFSFRMMNSQKRICVRVTEGDAVALFQHTRCLQSADEPKKERRERRNALESLELI